MQRFKAGFFLLWVCLFGLFGLTLPVQAETLITCSGSTKCTISVFNSAAPTQYTYHTIELVVPEDSSGNPVKIPDNNRVTFKYDGQSYQITCDGTPHNLGTSSYFELQNKISCTVAESRTGVNVNLTIFDQNTYANIYSKCPGYTIDTTLKDTDENNPYCVSDNSIAQTSACKWEKQNTNDSLLNQRGVPLNDWVVYAKTTVTGLQLGYAVNSGESSTLPSGFNKNDYVCVDDLNGNGQVDEGEIKKCLQVGSQYLCPINMVKCDATYEKPSCPNGTLNPDRDMCQADANIKCPSGYKWDSSLDKCVTEPRCPDGGVFNPKTDRCEKHVENDCPDGYSYDSNRDVCYKPVVCPSGTVYNPSADRCEKTASYSCPSGYTYNSSINKCERDPICPNGMTYSKSLDKCIAYAATRCPSGYTYNNRTGKCEASPQCPGGFSYNSATNRCEKSPTYTQVCPLGNYPCNNGSCTKTGSCSSTQVPYTDYQCPVDGRIYSSLTTCNNNCIRVGSCSGRTSIGGYGTSQVCWSSKDNKGDSENMCAKIIVSGQSIKASVYCRVWDNGDWISLIGSGISQSAVWASGTVGVELGIQTSNGNIRICNVYDIDGKQSCGAWVPLTGLGTSSTSYCEWWEWQGGTLRCTLTEHIRLEVSNGFIRYCNDHGCGSWIKIVNTAYTCSLNGHSYSSYSSCQNNCRQGQTCVTHTNYTTKWLCSLNNHQYDTRSQCTSSCYQTAACSNRANCPSGSSLAVSVCVTNPSCPSGGNFDGSRDVCWTNPSHSCSRGTYDSSSGYCVARPYCGSGTLNTERDKCEASITGVNCGGYEYDSSTRVCYTNSNYCGSNSYDNSHRQCVAAVTKNCGTYTLSPNNNQLCVKNVECPKDSAFSLSNTISYSPVLDECLSEAEHDCPSGYSWNKDTLKCEAVPICKEGVYNPDTNGCYVGDKTCPLGKDYPCLQVNGGSYCSSVSCVRFDNATVSEDTQEGAYDKKNDGQVDQKTGKCLGTIYIFNGHDRRCRTPGVQTGFTNCCHGGSDWLGLSKCNAKENQLAKLKDKGLCHYVGEYCASKMPITGICVQKKKTYCCFNSKLGRIIAEQGRPQLKSFGPDGGWGDPKHPNCRGFTPEEFQQLDFSKMDFSEFYKDVQQKAADMSNQIQNSVNNAAQQIQNYYK